MPQVRPVPRTFTALGTSANGDEYHLGLPNEDPTMDTNKITVYDGINGEETSNPFYVNSLGLFQNLAGVQINPWVSFAQYSMVVISADGGEQYRNPLVTSDTVTSGDTGEAIVGQTFNNQAVAAASDLSVYDTIYVQSENSGWESTIAGPLNGRKYHKDGTTGTPNTIVDVDQFYDANGDGWLADNAQFIGDGDVTGVRLNDDVAGDGLSKDGSDNLQVNVDNSTLEIDTDVIQVADDGITGDKIAPAVAGDGLTQDGSGNLEVDVDNNTIVINSNSLEVADDSITGAKLGPNVASNGLSQGASGNLNVNVDGSTIEINSDTLEVGEIGIANIAAAALASATNLEDGSGTGLTSADIFGDIVTSGSGSITFGTYTTNYQAYSIKIGGLIINSVYFDSQTFATVNFGDTVNLSTLNGARSHGNALYSVQALGISNTNTLTVSEDVGVTRTNSSFGLYFEAGDGYGGFHLLTIGG